MILFTFGLNMLDNILKTIPIGTENKIINQKLLGNIPVSYTHLRAHETGT